MVSIRQTRILQAVKFLPDIYRIYSRDCLMTKYSSQEKTESNEEGPKNRLLQMYNQLWIIQWKHHVQETNQGYIRNSAKSGEEETFLQLQVKPTRRKLLSIYLQNFSERSTGSFLKILVAPSSFFTDVEIRYRWFELACKWHCDTVLLFTVAFSLFWYSRTRLSYYFAHLSLRANHTCSISSLPFFFVK